MEKILRSRWLGVAAFVIALLGGFTLGAEAQGFVTQDSSWWRGSVPADAKVWVVEGMLTAYEAGWVAGATLEGQRFEDEAAAYSPAFQQTVHDISFRKLPDGDYATYEHKATFAHTFGYYESAIQDFYTTHPQSNDLEVGYVLSCLQDVPLAVCSSYK